MNKKNAIITALKMGQKASQSRTVTEADITLFGAVSGDFNPAHFNERYARGTRFGGRIAQGLVALSHVSAVLAMQLPGPGSIYLSQEVKFLLPVRIGDTITAMVEIIEIVPVKNRVILRTTCKNQDDALVLDGCAVIMLPVAE